jgi:hypothetical protein
MTRRWEFRQVMPPLAGHRDEAVAGQRGAGRLG